MPRRSHSVVVIATLWSAFAGCGGGESPAHDGGDASGDGSDSGAGGTAIVVDTPSGMVATEGADGYCDILEATAAAAFRRSVGECANPNRVARIVLTPGNSYPVLKTLRLLPGTEIEVAAGSAGTTTISAAAGFAVDEHDFATACLVYVPDAKPAVWLRDVTLTQDPSLTLTGVCHAKGTLNLRRVRVTGFHAGGVVATCLPSKGCDHEAIFDDSTVVKVLGSLIDRNRSPRNGAGISSEGSAANVFVAHSSIVYNTSDRDGGGLHLAGAWATDIIQSSTISGNTAMGAGGGLAVRYVEGINTYVHVFSTTIANNTAAGTGGGIEFQPDTELRHDVSVFSSIVAGNISLSTLEWNINAAWRPNGVFNCVDRSFIYVEPGYPRPSDSGPCVFDVRNPLLGPLTPMGGEGNLPIHPLLAGSPAVDAVLDETMPEDQRDPWIPDFDQGPTPAEWTMFDPFIDGDGNGTKVRDLGAYERNERWQTERLIVRAKGPAAHTVVTIPPGHDRGAGTVYAAAGTAGELVTFALPIGEAGRHELSIGIRKAADAGRFTIAIADAPDGPWTALGTEQDSYDAGGPFVSLGPFPTWFGAPGEKLVRFSVTGKNPASTGYRLYLDFIEAKRSTVPCQIADIAAGGHHSCVLTSQGGLRCWGGNDDGWLGDGGDRPRPPAVDLLSGVAAVATGGLHTCVLSSNGDVRCWGTNADGQLGDGSTTYRPSLPGPPVLSGVKAIAAGRAHTCALMTAGGVRCWGDNESGQLGDGSTTDRLRPPSTDVLTDVKAVTAGTGHTCVLTTGGGVRCWGKNVYGQLGDGTTQDRPTAPASDIASGIAAVSAGDVHTCALTNAGGVRCWGHNINGEIGIGSYDDVLSPPNSDVLTGVKQVVAGTFFTCALTTSGGVRCWGYNEQGATGDETVLSENRLAPQPVDILDGAASLAAGLVHVCARMTTGGVRCWGGNEFGQLGDGLRPLSAHTPPSLDGPGFIGTCE